MRFVGMPIKQEIFLWESHGQWEYINKHGYVLGVYIYVHIYIYYMYIYMYIYMCDFLTNMGFVLGEYQWDIRYQ